MPKRRNKEEAAQFNSEVVRLISSGLKRCDVAKELGVHPSYVSYIAMRNGMSKKRSHHTWTVKEEQILMACHKYNKKNIKEIKEKYFKDSPVSYKGLTQRLVYLRKASNNSKAF